MFLTCIDTYSLERNCVGKYRTPVARFPHRTLQAAERHRCQLIRKGAKNFPNARLSYIARLVEGEMVFPETLLDFP